MNDPVPTFGAVIGTLLNYRGAVAARAREFGEKPYLAPPRGPVLYVKPANTWIGAGAPIPLPKDVDAVEAGASLAIVIGSTATRVPAARALDFVGGYAIVNDVCEPHASVYRPAIRQRCRDGFCVIGPSSVSRRVALTPDALRLRVYVNGRVAAENTTANLVRPIAQLIADVTEFMTLSPGDLLLSGVPEGMPLLHAGDTVRIEIDGLGTLENPVVREVSA
jgi:5-oxopent-3-ene-1,2,5-tricarboxylate decarboxylase/2-hydroxyhepta-2,4-diene-1,7-dioate isomerase